MFVWGCNRYGQSTQDPSGTQVVNLPYKLGTNLFHGKVIEVKTGWTHLVANTGKDFPTVLIKLTFKNKQS